MHHRWLVLIPFALAACTHQAPDSDVDAGGETGGPDAAVASPDAMDGDDGVAHHVNCVNNFGTGLTSVHGRIDGTLVSLVRTTSSSCRGDSNHVHLQIEMAGAVYDVAVNILDDSGASVLFAERDLPLPGIAWSEGWHQIEQLDYVNLGLHDTDFTPTPKATLEQTILTELTTANHISVYMTGYDDSGGHLVHRNGFGNDGAIVIRPLSATAHILMFHFEDQTF